MRFATLLRKRNACFHALTWVGNKTKKEAWEICERGDWMLWLMLYTLIHDVSLRKKVNAICKKVDPPIHVIWLDNEYAFTSLDVNPYWEHIDMWINVYHPAGLRQCKRLADELRKIMSNPPIHWRGMHGNIYDKEWVEDISNCW